MTIGLAVAMVACQDAVSLKTPVTLGGAGLEDMSFAAGVTASQTVTITSRHFKGTKLDYTASSSNMNVAATNVSGSDVTVTPIGPGTATVTVIAAATVDDEEGTQSLSFTVTVAAPEPEPVNHPPTVRTISNLSLVVGDTDTITLSEYFTDPERDKLEYTSDSSDDMVAMVTDPDATSMITITAVAAGRASITVTADDGTNAVESQTFRVMVTEALVPDNNQPYRTAPLPNLTDLKVEVTPDPIDLSNHFSDDEDDDLDYDADSDDTGVVTVDVSGSMLTITVVAPGTTTIRVTVEDDANLQVKGSFNVRVVNQAPMTVDTEPTRFGPFLPEATQVVRLSRYFSDPEDDSLKYTAVSNMPDKVTVSEVGADSTITITAVAEGKAEIMITATDGTNTTPHTLTVTVEAVPNVAPVVVGDGIPDQSLQLVVDDETMTESATTEPLDLGDYFSDDVDNGPEPLSYSTDSEMAMVDGSMLTITASVAGTTMITVTASDGAGQVTDMFTVTVSNPELPERNDNTLNLQTFSSPSAEPKDINLGSYFSGVVEYRASSDNPTAVEADVEGEVLTLTPRAEGDAVVTVTPSNSGGDGAPLTFRVNVGPEPTPVTNNPPTLTPGRTVPQVSLVLEDSPSWMRDVSGYFMDADGDTLMYAAESSMVMYATAMVDETSGDLTITAVAEGTATVTVTASDGNGGSVSIQIHVTVSPVPNMAPRLKAGMTLGPFNRVENNGAAPESFDLDKYFEDPDGNDALITYDVKQDKKKENATGDGATATTSVIAVGGEMWLDQTGQTCEAADTDTPDGTGVEAIPDGTDLDEDILKICYENAGTAEIEITAIDAVGKRSQPVTVMFTVGANAAPVIASGTGAVATGDIDDHIGAFGTTTTGEKQRLKIGETRAAIEDAEFNKYFADENLESRGDGDMLTFEVKFFTALADPSDHAAITAALTGGTPTVIEEDDDGYGAVEAVMAPMSWNGDPKAKFTLSITGRKGTRMGANAMNQVVAIIATDTYGQKFARTFSVGVNHDPVAEGAQAKAKDKKTLSDETEYQNLIVPATPATVTSPTATLVLVEAPTDTPGTPTEDAKGGYFSDGDGAVDLADGTLGTGAGCVIKSTGGTDGVATFQITETAAGESSLVILAKARGTKTVTISCTDTFGVESPTDTLTVVVTGQISGSRQ